MACAGVAVAAFAAAPERPRFALGVLGGGVLIGAAFWALSSVGRAVTDASISDDFRAKVRRFALVKFFTRYAILAVGAYGMMARLHLDAIGMFVGVTTAIVAASIAAARRR